MTFDRAEGEGIVRSGGREVGRLAGANISVKPYDPNFTVPTPTYMDHRAQQYSNHCVIRT